MRLPRAYPCVLCVGMLERLGTMRPVIVTKVLCVQRPRPTRELKGVLLVGWDAERQWFDVRLTAPSGRLSVIVDISRRIMDVAVLKMWSASEIGLLYFLMSRVPKKYGCAPGVRWGCVLGLLGPSFIAKKLQQLSGFSCDREAVSRAQGHLANFQANGRCRTLVFFAPKCLSFPVTLSYDYSTSP